MPVESGVLKWKYSHLLKNEKNNFSKNDILNVLPINDIDEAYKVISSWNNYLPTPLILLNKLSEKLKLNKLILMNDQVVCSTFILPIFLFVVICCAFIWRDI